ncbi:MAG: orotidine-5'-phosphate decarboxylase [Dethiobacter sp.]|jgi:orotidine-5'-phosphate decarboxylase|nr:MAG: orotidine-5'-phosphate decarboxylase [Dethiobacter sp.]
MFGKRKSLDNQEAAEKIIVALDVEKEEEAYALVRHLSPLVKFYKVGMRLYVACGPGIITGLKNLGAKIFLDLKFHDIPHTVASTAEVVTRYGVDMFNIHLSGGSDMIRAAVEAAAEAAAKQGIPKPLVVGVTVLTSFNEKVLREETGVEKSLEQHVLNLSLLGMENGLNGVVASPREAEMIRKKCGEEFLIVTPGVRPLWSSLDDQLRVLTPRQALEAGASFLVIGRPIIEHASPQEAVEKILAEMTN